MDGRQRAQWGERLCGGFPVATSTWTSAQSGALLTLQGAKICCCKVYSHWQLQLVAITFFLQPQHSEAIIGRAAKSFFMSTELPHVLFTFRYLQSPAKERT